MVFVFYRFRVMVWCIAWGRMRKARLTRTGSWDHGEPCLTAWHRVRIVKDRGSREVNPATGLPIPGGLFMCVYLLALTVRGRGLYLWVLKHRPSA